MNPKDLTRDVTNNWCPGCGNHAIELAIQQAIIELELEPEKVVLVSGIGCSSKMPYWVKTIGFNSIHGRALPVAEGIKFANHKLNLIVHAGDGDGYGEGVQHFIHACKRNMDIAYFVHNNQVYALTKGQTSPTSREGFVTKTTPDGNFEIAFNPISVAIASGATFVARGFAGDIAHLKWLMTEAIKHKGFAVVDILQPCITFNHINTFQFWKERIYKLQEEHHDMHNKQAAFEKALEFGDRVPLGVFYREHRHTYEEKVFALRDKPLIKQPINNVDVSSNMEKFV